MNTIHAAILVVVLFEGAHSYNKFGRKCEDIGCASDEECVIASKPCSYYNSKDSCGEYPTCKKVSSGARTCDTYICPPSNICKMDGGVPKCFDDSSKVGKVSIYDTSNLNNKYDNNNGQAQPNAPAGNHNPSAPSGNHNPSAPSSNNNPSGGSLYPNIGGSGNNYQGGYNNPGYQQPGGAYQRPAGNYGGYQQPQNNYGGYPGYNNRPTGGYGQQNGGYGQQNGGYGGYNQAGGYYRPQQQSGAGYGGYGTNNGYGQGQYAKGSGSSFTDSLKEALKKIGVLILVSHYIAQNYWR